MKKNLLFITIGVLFSIPLSAGTVTTTGRIGRVSKACSGLGLCKVETNTNGLLLVWEFAASLDILKLHINKEELAEKQPSSVAEFHNKTQLSFLDPTEIPPSVVDSFDLQQTNIPPGTYPSQETTLEYIISFQL